MTAQSVILPLPSDHARFIVLRLKDLSITELKDMRRHNIKQPSGAVRNTNKVPIVHAGNKSCNHSIMA